MILQVHANQKHRKESRRISGFVTEINRIVNWEYDSLFDEMSKKKSNCFLLLILNLNQQFFLSLLLLFYTFEDTCVIILINGQKIFTAFL